MIDRREWIKTCIAAASAALLDTSGLPVVKSDADDESSVSVSTSGRMSTSRSEEEWLMYWRAMQIERIKVEQFRFHSARRSTTAPT